MMRWSKILVAITVVLLAGFSCSTDDATVRITMDGTLSGIDCWFNQPFSPAIHYSVTIDDLSEGAHVELLDENGILWEGTMDSATSFSVSVPDGDPRFGISVSELTGQDALVEATTTCVSFRCCSTATGRVAVQPAP